MKQKEIDAYVRNLVDEFNEHLKSDNFISAYEALGELFNLINNFEIKPKIFYEIQTLIDEQLKNEIVNKKVSGDLREVNTRLYNILSIGRKFIEEEFFLIFSLRFRIVLINNLTGMAVFTKKEIDEIDNKIIKIGSDKVNKREYLGVVNSLKRTWYFVFANSKFDV